MKARYQIYWTYRLLLCVILLGACNNAPPNNTLPGSEKKSLNTVEIQTSEKVQFANTEGELGQSTASVKVGAIVSFIEGRFSDGNKTDTAYVIKTKQGVGNPAEDGTADEYAVRFTGSKDTINIGCCDARLINEGDLNKEGRDELSIFQYPENGNTCRFYTYTFFRNKWNELLTSFLVPAAGERLSDSELQAKVIAEHGTIYYYDMVDSNEAFVPVKTKAILK